MMDFAWGYEMLWPSDMIKLSGCVRDMLSLLWFGNLGEI
jgi:hypothetical protein